MSDRKSNLNPRHTLRNRVTLVMTTVLVCSVWALAFYAERTLQGDMENLFRSQQLSVAVRVAQEVRASLLERQEALKLASKNFDPHLMANPMKLQRALENLPVFQSLFNGGTFIAATDGNAIASLPVAAQRIGVNYLDRDYITEALTEDRATIGKPVTGRRLNRPVLGMAAPIHDPAGRVIGVLAGITNLSEPNFLDRIKFGSYGKNGTYLLVDAENRLIVTASDPKRTMEALPPPNVNKTLDRFIDGRTDSAVFVNPLGVEVLSAVGRIPEAGWYIAVAVPTSEAFASIQEMRRRLMYATVAVTLISMLLIWVVLGRQLLPLQAIARRLMEYSGKNTSVQRLPVVREDEIGQVATSFNRLLDDLEDRQKKISASEMLYRTAFQTTPDALTITRLSDGTFLEVNDGFTHLYGWTREEALGKTSFDLGIWRDGNQRSELINALIQEGYCHNVEADYVRKDGALIAGLVSANRIVIDGTSCMLAITHDNTTQKAAIARIQQLAFADPLTGLPNRRLFLDRLQQGIKAAIRHGWFGALMYVDLDNFKTLNDTQGHDQGDLLLQLVTQRLKATVREDDTVARLGGDEFVVILEHLGQSPLEAGAHVESVAIKILAALDEPYRLGTTLYHCSASVGLTLFGESEEPASEPLKRADMAMYQAKAVGRNAFRFFDPEMQAVVSTHARIESSLRLALKQNELHLHYQIQITEDNHITGVEALIRWTDSRGKSIPPVEFIPVAEDCGLILQLGLWVLETACRTLEKWSNDPNLEKLSVAVNVSAKQFHHDSFVSEVKEILTRTGAPARQLKLELTESVLLKDIEVVIGKMQELKALGIGFAIDDFGTGFSSLSYLKRLPIDELKIDQSFVRDILIDPNDLAIAKMVIALGNSLGLTVIAEGVQVVEQQVTLAALGCHNYQGYLFGKPIQLSEVEARIHQLQLLDGAEPVAG